MLDFFHLLYLTPWVGYDLPMEEKQTKLCAVHKGTFPADRDLDAIYRQLEEIFEYYLQLKLRTAWTA